MLYKTLSAAVYGIDATIIEVEVDVSGIKTMEDHFHTVGLPDAAVRESRDRVRAALKNCGYDIPPTHITINLAPEDIRKEGSGFDLPMALVNYLIELAMRSVFFRCGLLWSSVIWPISSKSNLMGSLTSTSALLPSQRVLLHGF
jgi:hypothetical protein